MYKQKYYREKYKLENPHWNDSMVIYRNTIDLLVGKESRILDVGCGHGNWLEQIHIKTDHSYGIDPDAEALAKNTFIRHKEVASVEKLPFEDNFFDVVFSAWVLEHLPDPVAAHKEIYRVLKPGGKMIFITPNVWNYNVWIIRLIPERFHGFFTSRLYNRPDVDTYPKTYKINSKKSLERILYLIGFKKVNLILNGDPTYISFNWLTYRFATLIEWFINLRPFRFMKVHLVGVYQK